MGSQEEVKIENDFILLRFQNETDPTYIIERPVSQGLIQFHFGIKGILPLKCNRNKSPSQRLTRVCLCLLPDPSRHS